MKAAITKTIHTAIKGLHVTEKAALLAEKGVYVFSVHPDTTKKSVAAAVKKLYKVNPIRIALVKRPSKTLFRRGKLGVKAGGLKAYVTLKKGEKIEVA